MSFSRWTRLGAAFAAAFFLCAFVARGEGESRDTLGNIVDSITDTFDYLGQQAGKLLGRERDGMENLGASQSREVTKAFPVKADAVIAVSNKFGEIRVETWDDQVVQVRADIFVNAENDQVAAEIADGIEVSSSADDNNQRVQVETVYPRISESANVSIEVNYSISVPAGVKLICENHFGDTIIRGVGGGATVLSRFGVVDLGDLAGSVSVNAWGEFPVQVRGLRNGGSFVLHKAQAEFSSVSGALSINNFMGATTLRNPGRELTADITADTGPIDIYLAENGGPYIAATAVFGRIISDLPLAQTVQGDYTVARNASVESAQRLQLAVVFGDIRIHREGDSGLPQALATRSAEDVNRILESAVALGEGAEVAVQAAPGNIVVEAADGNELRVTARQLVRVQSTENARAALDALEFAVAEELPGRVTVRTDVRGDLQALGCSFYRIDLTIQCPRTAKLTVRSQQGHTAVSGMLGALNVQQAKGSMEIAGVEGPLELVNEEGEVRVLDCKGPLAATSRGGGVHTRNVQLDQQVNVVDGRTVVDAPHGPVFVRNRGGDVRIIALDGIGGAYDLAVQDGNLSIVLPSELNASFNVTATSGEVHSAVLLTGSVRGELRQFTGLFGEGAHNVTLSAGNGNIIID